MLAIADLSVMELALFPFAIALIVFDRHLWRRAREWWWWIRRRLRPSLPARQAGPPAPSTTVKRVDRGRPYDWRHYERKP